MTDMLDRILAEPLTDDIPKGDALDAILAESPQGKRHYPLGVGNDMIDRLLSTGPLLKTDDAIFHTSTSQRIWKEHRESPQRREELQTGISTPQIWVGGRIGKYVGVETEDMRPSAGTRQLSSAAINKQVKHIAEISEELKRGGHNYMPGYMPDAQGILPDNTLKLMAERVMADWIPEERFAKTAIDTGDFSRKDAKRFLEIFDEIRGDEAVQRWIGTERTVIASRESMRELTNNIHKVLWQPENMAARSVFSGITQAGLAFANLAARSIWDPILGSEMADEGNRVITAYATAAAQMDEAEDIAPWVRTLARTTRGAIRSATTAGATAGLGMWGMPVYFGAQRYDQAITEAKDAGLTGWQREVYALRAGSIEAGIATAFNAVGLGGFEKMMGGTGQVTKQGLREFFKRTGIVLLHELPEEIITELLDNVNQALSGINKDAWNTENVWATIRDTTLQTIMTVGLGAGTQQISAGLIGKDVILPDIAALQDEVMLEPAQKPITAPPEPSKEVVVGKVPAAEATATIATEPAAKVHRPEVRENDYNSVVENLTGFVKPPAPQQAAVAETEGFVTSIKNAVIDAELAAMGKPPAKHGESATTEKFLTAAKVNLATNPHAASELVASLDKKIRPVSGEEDFLLLFEQVRLKNERRTASVTLDEAIVSGDKDATTEAEARVNRMDDALGKLADIVTMAGTENSHGLYFRRVLMKDDYSIAELTRAMKASKAVAELTPIQVAEVKKVYEQLEKVQSELDAMVAEKQQPIAAPKRHTPTAWGAGNRIISIDRASEARTRLKSKLAHMNMGLDPTMFADLAQLGMFHLEAGATDFTAWSKKMLTELGDKIQPHLDDTWKANTEQLQKLHETDREKILDDSTIEESLHMAIGVEARELAREAIRSGINDRQEVLNTVHEALSELFPEMTIIQTAIAISGHGKYARMSKDVADMRLREIVGELHQVLKIVDMTRAKAPPRTGRERHVQTDEERRLAKLAEAAKKRGGYVVTDPETQLRTALDEVQTRVRHQITDYTAAIANRKRIVAEKGEPVALDKETGELIAERDELRKVYNEMFKTPLTDKQRAVIAERAINRSIAELERRIRNNDLFPTKETSLVPNTALISALRARREALRAEMKALQDSARPKLTAAERWLQAYRTRLTNLIAEYADREARNDYTIPKRKPVELDKLTLATKHELDKIKRTWHRGRWVDKRKRRSLPIKAIGLGADFAQLLRAIMASGEFSAVFRQGGFVLFGHPIRGLKALPAMFRATLSERGQFKVEQEIINRENYSWYMRSGLYLSEHGQDLSKMEEAYMSRFADRIPLVAASQRAYTTFLNKLRADSFDAMVKTLGRKAVATDVEASAIANFVNVATGRGNVGSLRDSMVILNTVFFAPRYVVSRFQLLVGQPLLYKSSFRVKKQIAIEYARFFTGLSVVYALGSMAGGEVEDDWYSSDFGKLRFGDARIDPLSGMSQAIVFTARIIGGQYKSSVTGKSYPLRGEGVPYGKGTGITIMNFMRSKLSPMASIGWDIAEGKDYSGQPLTVGKMIRGRAVPMTWQDIYEAFKHEDIDAATALSFMAFFGVGLQIYTPYESDIGL